MPARDLFHTAILAALRKEEWTITADPLVVQIGGVDLYIDLGAEKIFAAQKDNRFIAVEIKSFIGPSVVADFHVAIGQFLNYRLALELHEPQREMYLAVPVDTFVTFFQLPFAQLVIQRNQIRLIVYDAELQEILQWIP